jgi:hypothetical protein
MTTPSREAAPNADPALIEAFYRPGAPLTHARSAVGRQPAQLEAGGRS